MIHDVVDLPHWQELFQCNVIQKTSERELQRERADMTSPFQLVINERLREMAGVAKYRHQAVPTDIFIFAQGEPSRREVTKIGGLPYRPANLPWLTLPSGKPMTFVAQFCFADSRDILGSLPGDVLLIFAENDEYGIAYNWLTEDEMQRQLVFEWVSFGDFPLVTAEMIPRSEWRPFPCFGAIHRTYDYPTFDDLAHPDIAEYIPGINSATKIGGCPSWIHHEEILPGQFLCELNSTMPEQLLPYPFLNQSEPLVNHWVGKRSRESQEFDDMLLWGNNVGTLYLFIDDKGQIHWTIQLT